MEDEDLERNNLKPICDFLVFSIFVQDQGGTETGKLAVFVGTRGISIAWMNYTEKDLHNLKRHLIWRYILSKPEIFSQALAESLELEYAEGLFAKFKESLEQDGLDMPKEIYGSFNSFGYLDKELI